MTNTTNIPAVDRALVADLFANAARLSELVDATDSQIYRLQAELSNLRAVADQRRVDADKATAEAGSMYMYSVTVDTVHDREEHTGLNIAEVGALLARTDYDAVYVENETIGIPEDESPAVWAAARLYRAGHEVPMFNVEHPEQSFASRRLFGRG